MKGHVKGQVSEGSEDGSEDGSHAKAHDWANSKRQENGRRSEFGAEQFMPAFSCTHLFRKFS